MEPQLLVAVPQDTLSSFAESPVALPLDRAAYANLFARLAAKRP